MIMTQDKETRIKNEDGAQPTPDAGTRCRTPGCPGQTDPYRWQPATPGPLKGYPRKDGLCSQCKVAADEGYRRGVRDGKPLTRGPWIATMGTLVGASVAAIGLTMHAFPTWGVGPGIAASGLLVAAASWVAGASTARGGSL